MSTTALPTPVNTQLSTESWSTRLALTAFAALWWLPFLLPLAQPPLKHFHAEWLAGMLGLIAIAALLFSRNVRIVLPTSAAMVVVLAGYCAAQPWFVRMAYAAPSQSYALYLLWSASIIAAAATLRHHVGMEPIVRTIAWTAVAAGMLSAGLGMLQHYGSTGAQFLLEFHNLHHRSAQGNVGHPNYFGDHLLFAAVSAGYLFSRARLSWITLSMVSVVLACGIALSGSRGTVLSLIVVLALATAMSLRTQTTVARRLLGASVLTLVMIGCATLAAPSIDALLRGGADGADGGTLADRIKIPDAMGTDSRLFLWRQALSAAMQRPFLGHGPDAFASVLFERQQADSPISYTTHSHNLLTEILVSFGLAGTMILLALLAHLSWQHRMRILDPAWWPVTAMTVVLGVRSMLDLPLWFAHFLGITAVLAGLMDDRVRVLESAGRGPRFALLAAIGLGAVLLTATLRVYLDLSGFWRDRTPPAQMDARIQIAQQLPFFTALGDSMRTHLPPLNDAFAQRNLARNTRSMAWRPHPRIVYRQVALLALNDREADACALLQRAHLVYPGHDGWFETLLTQSRTAPDQRLDRVRAIHARLRAGASACGISAAISAAAPAPAQASIPH